MLAMNGQGGTNLVVGVYACFWRVSTVFSRQVASGKQTKTENKVLE